MTPALMLSLVTMSPFALVAPLASPPESQLGGQPELVVIVRGEQVRFDLSGPDLSGPDQRFLGVVLGSLSFATSHYLVDLPPLLTDSVVLGFGLGDARDGVQVTLPASLLPSGVRLYAQGVTLADAAVQSSEVMRFAIDR